MLNVNYNNIENCNIGILKIEILNFVVSYIGILKHRMVVQLNRECLNKEFGNITLKQLKDYFQFTEE